MQQPTRRALAQLNRRFYAANAASFDETRTRPWQGWSRALAQVPARTPLRVLDLGCGNGRLLTQLQPWALDYLGIDECEPLLHAARARHADASLRFERGELIDPEGAACLPEGAFDLVALMGVLHHIPSEQARLSLVRAASARLAPEGLLVMTAWHFLRDARLRRRVVPWSREALDADPGELEPGDALLRWSRGTEALRYAHDASDAEVARWIESTPCALADRFFADGPSGALNEYVVLRAQPV